MNTEECSFIVYGLDYSSALALACDISCNTKLPIVIVKTLEHFQDIVKTYSRFLVVSQCIIPRKLIRDSLAISLSPMQLILVGVKGDIIETIDCSNLY